MEFKFEVKVVDLLKFDLNYEMKVLFFFVSIVIVYVFNGVVVVLFFFILIFVLGFNVNGSVKGFLFGVFLMFLFICFLLLLIVVFVEGMFYF